MRMPIQKISNVRFESNSRHKAKVCYWAKADIKKFINSFSDKR